MSRVDSVPSLIDNLVTALYGSFYNPITGTGYIKKQVVRGRIIWNIPCDPNDTATVAGVTRNSGEGLLCYLLRVFQLYSPANYVSISAAQTLTNKTLVSPVITTPTGILTTDLSDFVFRGYRNNSNKRYECDQCPELHKLSKFDRRSSEGKFLIKALQEQLPLPR